MSANEIQLLTVITGFVATILAVAITGLFAILSDRRRIKAENQRHWQGDRFQLVGELLTQCLAVDRYLRQAINTRNDFEEGMTDVGLDVDNATIWLDDKLEEAYRTYTTLALLVGEGPLLEHAIEMINDYGTAGLRLGLDSFDYDETFAPVISGSGHSHEVLKEARRLLV